jgi:hypothetical protein
VLRNAIVAGAICTSALAAAAPADAYLRDLQTLDTGLSTNSLDRKTVQSRCPAGKTALGAGAVLRPAQGTAIPTGLALQGVFPAGDITADEADPISGVWTLAGQTQCATVSATRPPTLATSGPYVKNVRIVSSPLGYNRTFRKEEAVDCPADAPVPIGGGFFFDGTARNSAHLAAGRSLRLGGRFAAEAHRTDVSLVAWALSASAICADVSSPARPGQSYVTNLSPHSAASPINSTSLKSVVAECPPGKILVGGGGYVETPGTNPPFSVVLRSSGPSAPAGRPQYWFASGYEEDPESPSWRVVAKAICATPAPV